MRALQGIGGSGLYSMTMIIALNAVPPEKNGLIAAMIGVTLTIGGIVGPLLSGKCTVDLAATSDRLTVRSGAICNTTTWRWIFYLNLPTGAIALVGFIISWPKDKTRKAFTKSSFLKIDYLGSILLLAASSLIVYVMQEAGTYVIQWDSAMVGAMLTLVPACFIGFIVWQMYIAAHPEAKVQMIFPVQIIVKQRVIAGAVL